MTEYIFTNNAQGQLLTAIGTGSASLTLKSGEGAEFPSPGTGQAFFIKVYQGSNYEWMLCTGRSSDILTVTRGQEGTDPQYFAADSYVIHPMNKTVLGQFLQKGVYRENDGDPDGVLAAAFTGEEVLDTTNSVWYKHVTGTTWKAMHS